MSACGTGARRPCGNIGVGVVRRADGAIATAAHVVRGGQSVIVKLDADIALLQVDERWPQEPPLGSSKGLHTGDWVVAVGEPFAPGWSPAALRRFPR